MTIKADGIVRRSGANGSADRAERSAAGLAGHSQDAASSPRRLTPKKRRHCRKVVVTGSRIAASASSSPSVRFTAITADEVRNTGVTRVEDLLKQPARRVVADQGSGLSMGIEWRCEHQPARPSVRSAPWC